MALYLALVIFPMETRVNPMSGQWRTSFERIVVVLELFGILICKFPFPMAWKYCLSATVIDFGTIEI